MKFKTTADIPVPEKIIDQIIGQDKAVDIIKKAAKQKRNVLLIGTPGTGKSMMAQGMAELMPAEELQDVLAYPNKNNENQPLIRVVRTYPDYAYLRKNKHFLRYYSPKELDKIKKLSKEGKTLQLGKELRVGLGRRIAAYRKPQEEQRRTSPLLIMGLLALILLAIVFFAEVEDNIKWFVIAIVLGLGFLYVISSATAGLGRRLMPGGEQTNPKLIVDNSGKHTAPFVDATGTRAGALLGDCKHDPLQSGGLGTPSHLRVEAGALHQANKGVLFIDEIASLKMNWQQEILTAMQEKKYPITGQSEMSSGALVKTQVVPQEHTIAVTVPKKIIGDRPQDWGYLVVLTSQEGFPATGNWRVREVLANAEEYRLGGGRDDNLDPNIIDILAPEGISQEEILGAYEQTGEEVVIPMVRVR